MMYADWIRRRGRTSKVAAHCGLTPSAVSAWRLKGVPRKHMKTVLALSDGQVSIVEMLSAVQTQTPIAKPKSSSRIDSCDIDRILTNVRGSVDLLLVQLQTLEALTRTARSSPSDFAESDAGR
jgi:hypothetical protein